MKFFIAGIMQGSKVAASLHAQNYRDELVRAIQKRFPDAEIYDPLEKNQNSLTYDFKNGRDVFLNHNRMCGEEIDVLVAYAPEASMGTAIEMWEAWKNDARVLTISPMTANWVVKFLSDAQFDDLDAFYKALESGAVSKLLQERPPRRRKRSYENPDSY